MNNYIDFYFDFISPYSYLAHKKIINLNQRNIFKYKAILLGGLHNLAEITPPAFNEKKIKNMKDDCILISKKNKIPFKWNEKFPINSLYLMRQLNVALNRDIFRIKRAAFYNNDQIEEAIANIKSEYPRMEIYKDQSTVFFKSLQINSALDLMSENPIFIIDPYGRVVMYFDVDLDPKKILKDLKVLI